MKRLLPTGTAGERKFVVESRHTIEFPDLPPVLSTPSLVWFLEHAAIEALESVLEPGELSVGTEIEIQHLAPTPLGLEVTCRARVVRADGTKVSFQVEARDGHELIARGSHTRFVVRTASFAKRVQAKTESPVR
jgi:fluoroacetyl-CoA thioesterase